MAKLPIQIAGLGVPAGGTDTLLHLLEAHPEVASPIVSTDVLSQPQVDTTVLTKVHLEVSELPVKGLRGMYLIHTFGQPQVAQRISRHLPEAKVVLVLRNPIECLIAAYEAARRRRQSDPAESCAEFIARQARLQTTFRYSEGLTDLYGYYGPTSLQVVLYDDLRSAPVKTMKQVFGFLGIADTFVPPAIAHYVVAEEEASPGRIRRLWAFLTGPVRRRLTAKTKPVVPPPYEVSDYLSALEAESLQEWYRSDAVALSSLLDRDMVEQWRLR